MTHNAETSAHANWDAQRYDRVARPHAAWGATVLDRLSLDGDEVVLDAGCGSGRITAQLLERLPRGRVIAADNSPTMLAEARVTLAPFGARAEVVEADLVEIDTILDAPVDAIFSTAVFHWIADHERLFAALRRVVRAGGPLVAQCGGAGNLAQFMAAADDVVARPAWRDTFAGQHLWRHYYTPEVTEQQMRAAGFATVEAGLEPSPQTFASPAALGDFCRGVVLTSHVSKLPEAARADFVGEVVAEVVERLGGCTLDYVRLNIAATA
jgi:trans-aconitate 2-methyltransferase